jgi:hypothetical protein
VKFYLVDGNSGQGDYNANGRGMVENINNYEWKQFAVSF